MRFALLNSGLGLLAAASELHHLRPDADLVIAMDPEGMPWGPRPPKDIAERSLRIARAAASYEPDVIVMACNTGSVHALEALRAEFEPEIPVVGTVPAIKIAAAIADAARRTPDDCGAVVMGCTEYELAADQIGAAVPGAVLFGSAAAVAAQALRRALQAGAASERAVRGEQAARAAAYVCNGRAAPGANGKTGTLNVLLSGRRADLPAAALQYRQGRELAALIAGADPAANLPV